VRVIDDLLSGSFDAEDLILRAKTAGFDFTASHAGLLVAEPTGPSSLERTQRLVANYVALVPNALVDPLRPQPTGHGVVLAPIPPARWRDDVKDRATRLAVEHQSVVVAFEPVGGPRSIRHSYEEAASCLRLATLTSCPGLVTVRDLGICRALEALGEDRARQFLDLDHLGRQLLNQPRLLETLDALWRAEGQIKQAAHKLGISERATRRRLARLAHLTGLDPAKPADRVRLDVVRHALRLFRLR
jgi:sugar diacid utilization regulator